MVRIHLLGKIGYFKFKNREKIENFVINQFKKNDFDTVLNDFRKGVDAAKRDFIRIKELNIRKCIGRKKMIFKHPAGIKIANYFMFFRYKLKVISKRTVEEVLTDKHLLLEVLDGIIRIAKSTKGQAGNKIGLKDFFTVGGFSASAQKLGNFMPAVAKTVYEEFAPVKNGKILDISAGFGGRLVGAMSSKYNYEYIGVDPSTKAIRGLRKLIKFLNVGDRAKVIKLPFEDSDGQLEDEYFDLCFTSPPYFKKEIYSDEPTQSCHRYSEIDDWKEGFLKKSFEIVRRKLKRDKLMLINIANVKIKGEMYNLEDIVVSTAKEVGFKYIGNRLMEMSLIPSQREKRFKNERIFIFKKQ